MNITNKEPEYGMCRKAGQYIKVVDPMHPFSDVNGLVQKHRWLLGKYLSHKYKMPIFILPYFDVHHKNGIKTDNRIENLEMIPHKEHTILSNFGNKYAKKDMSNRKCLQCNSNKTSVRKQGYPRWYKHNDGFICSKCYTDIKTAIKSPRMRYTIVKK